MGGSITIHRIAVKGKSAHLKLCPSSSKECTRALANEKNALLLAGKYVKVPSLLAYGRKRVGRSHHHYLLLEHLRGAPFVPERDFRSAADYLCILHSRTAGKQHALKKIDDAATYLVQQASLCAALLKKKKDCGKSIRKEAFSLLAAAKRIAGARHKAQHLSLNNAHPLPNNFTKTSHGIALSGWSHSLFTSPAADVCLFLSPFSISWRSPSHFSDENRNEFLQRYLPHLPQAAQDEILAECRRAFVPASAYLFLLALSSPSPPKHFKNILFVKKAAAQARQGFSPE